MTLHKLLAVLVLSAASVLGGCSDPNRSVIQGSVKIDGTPVEQGAIAFFPTDGKGSTTGSEILAGNYSAPAAPGTFRVEIRVPKKVGEQKLYNTPDSPVQPILQEILPEKYNNNSELQVDVVSGENTHDFDLKLK